MEIHAWFGTFDPEKGLFSPCGDVERMVQGLEEPGPCPEIQPDLRGIALSKGYAKSDEEYNRMLHQVALSLARRRLKEAAGAEAEILQMIETLDDLHQAMNLLDERLYEWSRLHREDTIRGRRLAEALRANGPMGNLAEAALDLRDRQASLGEDVSHSMEAFAPNLSSLAGPLLAARLLSRAGSLKHLAEMPSSAVQIMGSEKSLFKHLRGKAPSPKHGIIFRHPAISRAPRKLRGRVARTLAGKLAIAARMDYFSGALSPELKTSLEDRLQEIRRIGDKREIRSVKRKPSKEKLGRERLVKKLDNGESDNEKPGLN
jgi:nucleolar protein 56